MFLQETQYSRLFKKKNYTKSQGGYSVDGFSSQMHVGLTLIISETNFLDKTKIQNLTRLTVLT